MSVQLFIKFRIMKAILSRIKHKICMEFLNLIVHCKGQTDCISIRIKHLPGVHEFLIKLLSTVDSIVNKNFKERTVSRSRRNLTLSLNRAHDCVWDLQITVLYLNGSVDAPLITFQIPTSCSRGRSYRKIKITIITLKSTYKDWF